MEDKSFDACLPCEFSRGTGRPPHPTHQVTWPADNCPALGDAPPCPNKETREAFSRPHVAYSYMTSAVRPCLRQEREGVSPKSIFRQYCWINSNCNFWRYGSGSSIKECSQTTFSFIQSFDVLHNNYILTRKYALAFGFLIEVSSKSDWHFVWNLLQITGCLRRGFFDQTLHGVQPVQLHKVSISKPQNFDSGETFSCLARDCTTRLNKNSLKKWHISPKSQDQRHGTKYWSTDCIIWASLQFVLLINSVHLNYKRF